MRDGIVRTIVMPANNAITLTWIMSVNFETARTVFKFDSDSLFGVSDLFVCNAIRVECANLLNAVLQFLGDRREQKHHAHLTVRRILERSILQRQRSATVFHAMVLDYSLRNTRRRNRINGLSARIKVAPLRTVTRTSPLPSRGI